MIKQLSIENYKALRNVRLELTPVHALIGPNDSGKTSILEALSALCRSADFNADEAFPVPWEGAALVWDKDPSLLVHLGCLSEDAGLSLRYHVSCRFAQGSSRAAHWQTEDVDVSMSGKPVTLTANPRPYTRVNAVIRRGEAATVEVQDVCRRVYKAITGVHMYRLDPRTLSLPVAPDSKRRFRMEANGFGLALALDDILGFDRARFDALEERFQRIFPGIRSIKLMPEMAYRGALDSHGIPRLDQTDGKGLYFESDPSGQLISAAQVSDGVLLVLAYLTVLYLPQPPRVLLIEEPENGIHPKRLQDVLTILRELVHEGHHTQVLLTTHSPYVLDLFKPEEVTLCRRQPNGEVAVARLSESETVRKQLDIFGLGEIWTAEGDEKLAARAS